MADQIKKKAPAKKKIRDEFQEDDIFQAPVIQREPSSRQAKLGSKVVIRITAIGKPLPTFQWFHNGKKISGATTDRLTLSKIRRMAAGAYHCEAKNFVGKAVSRVCMLSFLNQKVPKLVIGPELSKVEEGKAFSLKVISPTALELKDFKIFWMFNGMRISGAHGRELNISAAKKKYEGEYKAMIVVGSGIETSNVAKLVLKPATGKANSPERLPPIEAESKTLEDILSQEPTKEIEASPPKATAERWEDSGFNPDEEEIPETDELLAGQHSRSLVAPVPGNEGFGNTSPGTPGAPKQPISQLATQDLIRELAAQGGASELIEEAMPQREDPSALIEASGKTMAPSAVQEDPSSLIESLESGTEPECTEDLIQDWGIEPAPIPEATAPVPIRTPEPSPKLVRKKEFLEGFLHRWQSRAGKKSAKAA